METDLSFSDFYENTKSRNDDVVNNTKTNKSEYENKLNMLVKLRQLMDLGVALSQNYNIDSDLKKMTLEYELNREVHEKYYNNENLCNKITKLEKTIVELNHELLLKNKEIELKNQQIEFKNKEIKLNKETSFCHLINNNFFSITIILYTLIQCYSKSQN